MGSWAAYEGFERGEGVRALALDFAINQLGQLSGGDVKDWFVAGLAGLAGDPVIMQCLVAFAFV